MHMTAQPRREFGQVDRLPSGRYRARFTGPDGRRISAPHTFTTRREAAEFLAKTRGELLAGNTAAVIPCTMTLAEYLTQYLHTERERLRPRTLDLYRRTAHHYLLNPVGLEGTPITLGTYQLNQLTPTSSAPGTRPYSKLPATALRSAALHILLPVSTRRGSGRKLKDSR